MGSMELQGVTDAFLGSCSAGRSQSATRGPEWRSSGQVRMGKPGPPWEFFFNVAWVVSAVTPRDLSGQNVGNLINHCSPERAK